MKKNNRTNRETKVFIANEKFFSQKVSEMFRKEGTSKHYPTYNGHILDVYVEFFEGKYYLSFKECGHYMWDFSKRIRKSLTMYDIDEIISNYYDERDEMHKKCVDTYNKAMSVNTPKKTRKQSEKVETTTTTNESETTSQSETTTNESDDLNEGDDYEKLFNEFADDYKFSLGNVGSYILYKSGDTYHFGIHKADKRQISGYRIVDIFSTDESDVMREYLIKNNPNL